MSLLKLLIGRTLASREDDEQKVGVLAGVPMLGLDALASSAYGPEAALTVLIPLGATGLGFLAPITAIILALLGVLYLSYRQTMAAYPGGGGSYTVAKTNLGRTAGLIAAAALLLDYVLVVAVGISAGVGALVSAVPSLNPYILDLGLVILVGIAVVNLRGVKESGLAFLLPTYLFVASLGAVLLIGAGKSLLAGGSPQPIIAPPSLPATMAPVSLWLLLRSFASGCTAMTGVEAVSNGMQAFAAPQLKNAQRTLTVIVAILGIFLTGIAYLAGVYHVGATEPGTAQYDSVVSQLVAAIVGRGVFYYLVIGSTLAVLALSANTGFADFPRLCRLLAEDDFLPHAFANRGRRLVYSRGIVVLTVLSAGILIAFGGVTDNLIPLFAVGAILAFTMSQLGMVVHWRRTGGNGRKLLINALGATATGIALVVILVAKFRDGAWITALVIPAFVLLFLFVRNHYDEVVRETRTDCDLGTDRSSLVVIVPIKGWDAVARKALEFALRLSPDVTAVHVALQGEDIGKLRTAWSQHVDEPYERLGLTPPSLVVVSSPYRRLFNPLLEHLESTCRANPGRPLAVVIPELVEAKWWQYLLHNQRAAGLKAALLIRGGRRIAVINVPWYLNREE